MAVRNVHERVIDAPADQVGDLLAGLGRDGDRLWPAIAWVRMRLDRPVAVGADGGHGPIRYWVSAYEPGRQVRFEFHPEAGLTGYHEFTVEPRGPNSCVARHMLEVQPRGMMRILTPLAIRPLHDAVLEDLLDNAEYAATGRVNHPSRWPTFTRLLWRLTELGKPRPVEPPAGAGLAQSAFDDVDVTDAWQVRLRPGTPRDPAGWARAIFFDPPAWVGALLYARNVVVRLIGVDVADSSAFAPVAQARNEILIGADGGQFDFRVSVFVEDDTMTLTTVARAHNRRGRAYLRLVWQVHPLVVKAMLRRAVVRLTERAHRNRFARPARTIAETHLSP